MVESRLIESYQAMRRVLVIFEIALVDRQKYLLLELHRLNDRIKIICRSFSITFLIIMIIKCVPKVHTFLLNHLQTFNLRTIFSDL